MFRSARRILTTMAALAALALGGSALAGAASNDSSSSSKKSSTASSSRQAPGGGPRGRHVGANGEREQALDADTAAKVKAAALAKVDGTVERTETDVDHGSPYEAHVRKADGTEVEVLVNKSFEVTAVNEMRRP